MTENLDAMRAVEHVDLSDREVVKAALATTLVKHHRHRPAFDTVFDVYFSLYSVGVTGSGGTDGGDADADAPTASEGLGFEGAGGAGAPMTRDELAEMLLAALMRMDRAELRRLAALAVQQFAAMEPGRPVGGTYYLYRTLRQLDLDDLRVRLAGLTLANDAGDESAAEPANQHPNQYPNAGNPLAARLRHDDLEARMRAFRALLEEEIRRRLVADRGVEAMARTLRAPLPEDVDFMHASREQILALQRAIAPLTRALAARLAQRRKHRSRGSLDFRKTVRASLSYGGVPADPKFRRPHPSKPEIIVIADISGSVASFARFTLQFVYAMASQFSKVRSWVFIDGIDEVTRYFQGADDVAEAVHRVNTEADVVWVDGHSDYGHAFEVLHERYGREVTSTSSVLFLGDARNNYHETQAWVIDAIRERARHVYWLNPEPRGYWDTGDSVMSEYAPHCDGVYECRNLRQLEQFVSTVVVG